MLRAAQSRVIVVDVVAGTAVLTQTTKPTDHDAGAPVDASRDQVMPWLSAIEKSAFGSVEPAFWQANSITTSRRPAVGVNPVEVWAPVPKLIDEAELSRVA